MVKKLLSLLICTAMLIGTAPTLALAAEADQKTSVKIGIEKGDIVSYAGKDGEPLRWRVIDAEKSNIGDENGILLLGEDPKMYITKINTMPYALDRLKEPVYNVFYDDYFTDFYRGAVIKTSVTDDVVKLSNNNEEGDYYGALTDDTVFALSVDEANKLENDVREFGDGNATWILRSAYKGKGMFYDGFNYKYDYDRCAYIYYNGKLQNTVISLISDLYFRPAVNIDRTKLAELDGAVLLLPAEGAAAADGALAPVGTASEWKLTQKENDVKITQTRTDIKSDKEFTLTVSTNLENPGGDDYISLIVKKGDGSISHYGRYAMTAAEKTADFTLPDGFDKANDAVYAFYENYNGIIPRSAGDLKKVCLEHDYTYESIDGNLHRFSCKNCAFSDRKAHIFETVSQNEVQHTIKCSECGQVVTENHQYAEKVKEDAKTFSCVVCAEQTPYRVKIGDLNDENVVFNDFATVVRDEYKEGTAKYTNCKFTSDRADLTDGFFTGGKYEFSDFTGGKACVTFSMENDVKALGFMLAMPQNTERAPSGITLYVRKSGLGDEYKIIKAVNFGPILQEGNYEGTVYEFLFNDRDGLSAYDDYKLELEKGDNSVIELGYFAFLSDSPASFTYETDGAIIDGINPSEPYAYPGEDLVLTMRSKNNHPDKNDITVMAKEEAASDYADVPENTWTYSQETGIFTLIGDYISNKLQYLFRVKCDDKTVNVEYELNRVTLAAGSEKADFGSEFSCIFTDSSGKKDYAPTSLTDGDIKVLCAGVDITDKCSYDASACKLVIDGSNVAGDIKIIAREKYLEKKESSQIKIERPGKPVRWYDSVADARNEIGLGGEMNITLLTDIYVNWDKAFEFNNSNVTLDLNGHELTHHQEITPVYAINGANVILKNGKITRITIIPACYVAGGAALYLQDVEIYPMPGDASYGCVQVDGGRLVVNNRNGSRIGNIDAKNGAAVEFKNGSAELIALTESVKCQIYSGTVGVVKNFKENSLEQVDINYSALLGDGCEFYDIQSEDNFNAGKPTGFSVKCLHKNVDAETGVCKGCDVNFAVMTQNGDAVNYYNSIYEAVLYANSNKNTTIKLLSDITESGDNIILSGKNTTLDMNGKTLESTDEYVDMVVSGSLKIIGNGCIKTTIHVQYESTLTIESGEFKKVWIGHGSNVVLNGGKFNEIETDNNDFTYADFLGEGKAYWSTVNVGFNTAAYEYKDYGTISQVEITDAPFAITGQPKGGYLEAGAENESVSVDISENPAYKGKIYYQWIAAAYDLESGYGEPEFVGEAASANVETTGLDGGVHRVYQCAVSCGGYILKTEYAMFTIGKGKPIVDFYRGIDAKGNDCVIIATVYNGDRFLGAVYKNMAKESEIMPIDYIVDPFYDLLTPEQMGKLSKMRIFFWDKLNNMIPIGDAAEIKNEE